MKRVRHAAQQFFAITEDAALCVRDAFYPLSLHVSSDTSLCASFRRALRKSKYHPVRDNGLSDSLAGLSPAKGRNPARTGSTSKRCLSLRASPRDYPDLTVAKEFNSRAIALAPSGRLPFAINALSRPL